MVWEEDPDEPELGIAGSADTNSAALKELSGIALQTSSWVYMLIQDAC